MPTIAPLPAPSGSESIVARMKVLSRAGAILGVAVVLAGCGPWRSGPQPGTALDETGGARLGQGDWRIEEPLLMQLWAGGEQVAHSAHFLKVEMLGVPDGMVIDRVAAL